MSDIRIGMLSPYRVLDLTDEKGWFCGKLLGDLGADVIKIEKPDGDPGRKTGPFYHDEAAPEKSLYWFAYNTNKRGITLNLESTDGQEIFKRLVTTADFVIESFEPGYLDKLGIGYAHLEKLNPRLIMVSISPFGQTGPYCHYRSSDVVLWALGGYMQPFGNEDRAPLRVSHHSQAYLHASAQATIGALLALRYFNLTGEGQHVDVSIQEAVAWIVDLPIIAWDMLKMTMQRDHGQHQNQSLRIRQIWRCLDGFVYWRYGFGARSTRTTKPFVEWMKTEGFADDFLLNFDFEKADIRQLTQHIIDRLQQPTARFLASHNKEELFKGGVEREVLLYPVSTIADLTALAQLSARGFWSTLQHPELGDSISYPGPFARASLTPPAVLTRAPLPGEHNHEIYELALRISQDEISKLAHSRII
jgi:crotonobetainyl-CoA:carnitine CoA-transferase CaiB-like acyl-CoA transferase